MGDQIQMTRVDLTNSEVELIKSGLMSLNPRRLGFDDKVKAILRKLKPHARTPEVELMVMGVYDG